MPNILKLDKAVISAARSAINKLARKARTHAGRAVRQTYAVKASAFNEAVKIERAQGRRLTAALVFKADPIPLISFSVSKTKRGVSVRIRKDRGRTLVKGGFLATVKAGDNKTKDHVVKRRGIISSRSKGWTDGRPRTSPRNLPIKALVSQSPAAMFEVEGERAVEKLVKEDLQKLFDSELRFYVNREFGVKP